MANRQQAEAVRVAILPLVGYDAAAVVVRRSLINDHHELLVGGCDHKNLRAIQDLMEEIRKVLRAQGVSELSGAYSGTTITFTFR